MRLIFAEYQAIYIDRQKPNIELDNLKYMSSFDLFSLYIMPIHLRT